MRSLDFNAVPVSLDNLYNELDEQSSQTVNSTQISEGFRVQLLSGRTPDVIDIDKNQLRLKYGYEVYLIYEAPFYKLRIGDFRTREEASCFCRILLKDGFSDAWIVKSPIIISQE